MVIFDHGFRLFFLFAGIWASAAILVWSAALLGLEPLGPGGDLLFWHSHEMLFGFAAAAMSGFLLTALPNWTGRKRIQGWSLAAFAALWLAGRAAMLTAPMIGASLAAVLDLGFLSLMAVYVAAEVWRSRNWRNLPVAALITLFAASNWLAHWTALGGAEPPIDGRRLAIFTLAILVAFIGGRIVPAFTRNWLVQSGAKVSIPNFGRFDAAAVGLLVLSFAAALAAPDSALPGWLALITAAVHFVRLMRWQGWLSLAEPLVWTLHLGYLWLVAGVAALGAAWLDWGISETTAMHALTTGAFGTMIIAVMTRASLGHSGRPLRAGPGELIIYLLVLAAGLARLVAPFWADQTQLLIIVAAIAWAGGFGLFSVLYFRLLTRPA